jgi:hypothetical protein
MYYTDCTILVTLTYFCGHPLDIDKIIFPYLIFGSSYHFLTFIPQSANDHKVWPQMWDANQMQK